MTPASDAEMDAEEVAADQAASLATSTTPSAKPVEVTVAHPFQVAHDGVVYGPGETATVPGDLAERWRACGYIT